MVSQQLLKRASKRLPKGIRSIARDLYHRHRHWAHPAMKKFGTVQDLYYWVRDGDLDTLLLIQNYFSALYPQVDTATDATVSLYSPQGQLLGTKGFSLGAFGCGRFRASDLLRELGLPDEHTFGTLEVHISIPRAVLDHIRDQGSVYFWDRFYLGYLNARGQTCFVHGVDKTRIYTDGRPSPVDWYQPGRSLQWAPEIPVDIGIYERFTVIMLNRTRRATQTTLTVSDEDDASLSWSAEIPPYGIHRFALTGENTAGLKPTELRMRINGMATQWGRPLVFKEFPNGAISAMHC